MVSRYTGACLGLLAFAVAVSAGLTVGNDPVSTLWRALMAMFLFCVLGLIIGACAQSAINEHHRRQEAQALPDVDSTNLEVETVSGPSSNEPEEAAEAKPISA